MENRNNGIEYKLYKEKIDKYRKVLDVYNKTFGQNPVTISDIIENSLVNLFDNAKNYTLKRCSVAVGTESVEVWIRKDIYLKMVDLAKRYPDVSYSNVVNFALDRYYLPFVKEYIRKILDKTLSIRDNLIKLLEEYSLLEEWHIKDRYIVTSCPRCETQGFYYAYSNEENKVFTGCINDNCIYRNRNGVDIYGLIKDEKNLDYIGALTEIFYMFYNFII